jgi:hypothetical protein
MSTAMASGSSTPPTRADFFIIGCQRSGTTLMRLILECHSRIECVDEGLAYSVLAGQYQPVRAGVLLGLKVPAVTEQFAETTLWDPTGLDEVPNPYQRQPLVFLVRDARDTIASMRALHVHGRRWIDGWLKPTLAAKRERCGRFAERYGSELAALDAAGTPELALAAFYWRYKTEACFDYLARGFPTLLVRYEDLVGRPGTELLRVCEFLDVEWEPALLAHSRMPHADVDDRGFTIGGTQVRRAINGLSVDRWRAAFTEEEAAIMLRFAGARQAELYPGH